MNEKHSKDFNLVKDFQISSTQQINKSPFEKEIAMEVLQKEKHKQRLEIKRSFPTAAGKI